MPAEVIINANKSFIGAWIIDDVNLCDRLISYFESSNEKGPGIVHGENGSYVMPSIKDSIDLRLDPNEEAVKQYAVELQKVVDEYLKTYSRANITSPWVIETANIQKYNPGGAYFDWHAERTSSSIPSVYRHLVFMTYLNDVEEGGETEFLYQEVKVKPRKGLTIVWPADWTHTHRGIPAPNDVKYIVTGWYIFVPKQVDTEQTKTI